MRCSPGVCRSGRSTSTCTAPCTTACTSICIHIMSLLAEDTTLLAALHFKAQERLLTNTAAIGEGTIEASKGTVEAQTFCDPILNSSFLFCSSPRYPTNNQEVSCKLALRFYIEYGDLCLISNQTMAPG